MRKSQGASYLSQSTPRGKSSPRMGLAFLSTLLAFISVLIACVGIFGGSSARADGSFDPVNKFFCMFGDDSLPMDILKGTETDDFQFQLRSKSSIAPSADQVDTGPWYMNALLGFTGHDFTKINNAILGTQVDPTTTDASATTPGATSASASPSPGSNSTPTSAITPGTSTSGKKASDANKGSYVSPFDRFGMAGLHFTAYQGEWKYVQINPCATGDDPQVNDPKAALFYQGRLTPRSTWEDVKSSKDVRTVQFANNLNNAFGVAFVDYLANFMLNLVKLLVTVAIIFIDLSFTDVVSLLGIDTLVGGSGSSQGIFSLLYQGLYKPLIVVVMAITGLYMFYKGIIKHSYREVAGILYKSLGMFFAAIVISLNPLWWVQFPNKVAVGAEAAIVTTMNKGLAGGSGLCSTDIGEYKTQLVTDKKASPVKLLEQASENMKSTVECSFWQQYLFTPWVQGQFGTSWQNLWAKGKIPSWDTNKEAKDLNNTDANAKMVGDATVPFGGGKTIDNWALFMVSTQTDAHVPYGQQGQRSKYSAGIANDWWRIADVLSNYTEIDKTLANGDKATEPDTTAAPLPEWNTWVGNSSLNRLGTSFTSGFVATVGLIAPLYFSVLASIYAVGTALLMAVAPFMLLMGCWVPMGFNIFKGWLTMLINTVLKRVATGVCLVIAIIISSSCIQVMESQGWWTGMLMMMGLSLVLINSRHQIMDALAAVNLGGVSFHGATNKATSTLTKTLRGSTKMATVTALGGVASVRHGGTFNEGAMAGSRQQLRNMQARHVPLRAGLATYDRRKHEQGQDPLDSGLRNRNCAGCQRNLGDYNIYYRDNDGNYFCKDCGEAGDAGPDAVPEAMKTDAEQEKPLTPVTVPTTFTDGALRKVLEDQEGKDFSEQAKRQAFEKTFNDLAHDVYIHKAYATNKILTTRFIVPEILRGYLDQDAVDAAWSSGDYDVVRYHYALAFSAWANGYINDVEEKVTPEALMQNELDAERLLTGEAKEDEENDFRERLNGKMEEMSRWEVRKKRELNDRREASQEGREYVEPLSLDDSPEDNQNDQD